MWRIQQQGFIAKRLSVAVEPHHDSFCVDFVTPHDAYLIYFDSCGRITHVRHYPPQESAHAPNAVEPVAK
jgi:hypothetical protein